MDAAVVAKDKLNIRSVVQLALASVSSWFLAKYLNIDAEVAVWLIGVFLQYNAVNILRRGRSLSKGALLTLGLFSAVFTLSLVLGDHIVVGDSYNGLSDENYIAPYSLMDLVGFIVILPGVFVMLAAPVSYTKRRNGRMVSAGECSDIRLFPLGAKWVIGLSGLIFTLWLPYLCVYWPGFIFGDSLSSINQALGNCDLSNHHPVAYTLFLWICLKVSALVGFGNTLGIGLSTIIQMMTMAFCLGYMSRWVAVRGSLHPIFGIGLALALGFCQYFASFSVSLWKDPLFSCACLVLSLCLADFAWSHGRVVLESRAWLVLFSVSSLVMVFLRNNGIFILAVAGMCFGFLSVYALLKNKRRFSKCSLVALASIGTVFCLFAVVTGPIYSVMGVQPSEESEAVGVPLNQMARVAALDGEMTESDKCYLDSIIPIEEYRNRYHPCCTDLLKWSDGFNNESLKDGMWGHWASMLVLNPNAYLQAWELQTFGFWAVNTEDQAGWSWNVSGGAPRNISISGAAVLGDLGIHPSIFAINENALGFFPVDSWSLPVSWLFWLSSYLAVVLLLTRKRLWILGLVPSLVLVFTLFVASPICYWPRYAVLLQLALPYYLLILLFLLRGNSALGLCKLDEANISC